QELAARAPEEMLGPETRTQGRKSPRMERREARRPDRKGRRGASQAPRLASRLSRATGASQAPGACRRSATPRFRGVEKVQRPGRDAPRERVVLRVGLFDIVRSERAATFRVMVGGVKTRVACAKPATQLDAGVRIGAPADLARRDISGLHLPWRTM